MLIASMDGIEGSQASLAPLEVAQYEMYTGKLIVVALLTQSPSNPLVLSTRSPFQEFGMAAVKRHQQRDGNAMKEMALEGMWV